MFLKRHFGPDRRRRRRQLLNTSVRVFSENGPLEALGINISDVGMSLFTIANLKVDSRVDIQLVPPGSSELVRISGTVRHRALYLYGIGFHAGSEQDNLSESVTTYERIANQPQ